MPELIGFGEVMIPAKIWEVLKLGSPYSRAWQSRASSFFIREEGYGLLGIPSSGGEI
jgi:hypothetical protein